MHTCACVRTHTHPHLHIYIYLATDRAIKNHDFSWIPPIQIKKKQGLFLPLFFPPTFMEPFFLSVRNLALLLFNHSTYLLNTSPPI